MSKGTAVTVAGTGEAMVLMPEHAASADLQDVLAGLAAPARLTALRAMSGMFDDFCAALLSPNDVVVEGARTFKKKSAWRKLQKAFRISTRILKTAVTDIDAAGTVVTVATVVVEASAPWNQTAEAVGACGSDEETERRTITLADMVATAETRATNRAVSNLIAAGEVSAEEIGNRKPYDSPPARRASGGASGRPSSTAAARPEDIVMPFGRQKNKITLGEMDTKDLLSASEWCREKGKFLDIAEAMDAVLAARSAVSEPEPEPSEPEREYPMPDDDIPF